MVNFWFAIPLRGKGASLDWTRVSQLLEATVRSALSSQNAVVRVVIACNEVPEIAQVSDPRVTFLSKDYPIPATSAHQMLDKRFKKFDLTNYVIGQGGGYMMLLDSDDFVSRDLASFVLSDDNRVGYTIDRGYIVDAETNQIEEISDFDRRCGSSTIVYLSESDSSAFFNWPLYVSVTQHQDFKRLSQDTARPFMVVPFAAAVALKNNGENHSYRFRGKGNIPFRKKLLSAISGKKPVAVSDEVRAEFALG